MSFVRPSASCLSEDTHLKDPPRDSVCSLTTRISRLILRSVTEETKLPVVTVEQSLCIRDEHRIQRRSKFEKISKRNRRRPKVLEVAAGKFCGIRSTSGCLSFSSKRRSCNPGQLQTAPVQNVVEVLFRLQYLLWCKHHQIHLEMNHRDGNQKKHRRPSRSACLPNPGEHRPIQHQSSPWQT